jgi:D-alanine-D-alanine ligase
MRITCLAYVEDAKKRELDPVVRQIAAALRKGKHQVSILAVHRDVGQLARGLARRKPDLVFNLVEMFGDDLFADIPVAGLLGLLGYKYTGGGPGELYLTQDKALSKKLLAFDGILYPRFMVFARDDSFETGGNLRMPMIVKPLRADSSIGIEGKKSLVTDAGELMRRVTHIQRELKDDALAEEYIEGREFYVGVLGNGAGALALPPVELDFTGFPDGVPRVADARAKWEEGTREYKGTRAVINPLPDELRARLQKVSLDACRALRVRDYGRVDMRLTETGEIYVLEVNASCYLERESEFVRAAAVEGISYDQLIQRIVELAAERYGM